MKSSPARLSPGGCKNSSSTHQQPPPAPPHKAIKTRMTREESMKHLTKVLLTATLIAGSTANAQKEAPEIRFDSAPNPLQLPAGLYLGEVGGVATNSRGDIFVYTRTGHPTISIGTARPFAHGG